MSDVQTSRPVAPHPTLHEYYSKDADRQRFVNDLFDRASSHYEWLDGLLSLGSGAWYRRQVLRKAGLEKGMKMLDVATGTGPVARIARELVGETGLVVGVDPSWGMLTVARAKSDIRVVRAVGEALPIGNDMFEMLAMGYALRHVGDLRATFHEYHRVLKSGGQLVVMELGVPRSKVGARLFKLYMSTVVPTVARLATRSRDAERLMQYYSDTTVSAVSPATVIDTLVSVGFRNVHRNQQFGVLTEYRATK